MNRIFWFQEYFNDKELTKLIFDLYKIANITTGLSADIYPVVQYNLDYYASNLYFPSTNLLEENFKDFKFIKDVFIDISEYRNYIKDILTTLNDKARKDKTLEYLNEPDVIKRTNYLAELTKIEIGICNSDLDLEDVTKFDYVSDYEKKTKIGSGPKTNIEDIDAIIGGFTAGKLMVVAAPQACFKTTFCINMSYLGIMEYESPNNTLILSLELPETEWYWKTIVRHSYKFGYNINVKSILKGLLTEEEKTKLFEVVDDFNKTKKHNMYIIDSSKIQLESILTFKQQLSNYIEKHNIKSVYVDYIQILKNYKIKGYFNPLDMLNDIVGLFHMLEVQYGVRVCLLSQINREGTKKSDSENSKGELKSYHLSEISNLERYAYYLVMLWTDEDLKRSNKLKFQLIKHRDGQTISKPKMSDVLPQYFHVGKNNEHSIDKALHIDNNTSGSGLTEMDLFED